MKMKIAIVGSYHYGNFGDDLMGLAIALYLKERGYDVVVHDLAPSIAESYQINSCASLNQCLDDAALCVIGGGALLTNYGRVNPVDLAHYSEIAELLTHIERKKIGLYCVSVGGGGSESEPIPQEVADLFSSAFFRGASFRLQSDLVRFKAFRGKFSCFPDVVLSMAACQPRVIRCSRGVRPSILINLPKTKMTTIMFWLLSICRKVGLVRELKTVSTYLPDRAHRAVEVGAKPELLMGNSIIYRDPFDFLRELEKYDLIVSHKLHLGVAASARGVRFLSFGGKGKTKGFLRGLGLERNICGRNVFKLIFSLLTWYRIPLPSNEQMSRAKYHFDELDRMVGDCLK